MPQKAEKARVGRLIPLFCFAMQGVLALMTAELLQFELLRHGFLVLGRRVISTFALSALERDDFSSCACHYDLRGSLDVDVDWSPRRDLNS